MTVILSTTKRLAQRSAAQLLLVSSVAPSLPATTVQRHVRKANGVVIQRFFNDFLSPSPPRKERDVSRYEKAVDELNSEMESFFGSLNSSELDDQLRPGPGQKGAEKLGTLIRGDHDSKGPPTDEGPDRSTMEDHDGEAEKEREERRGTRGRVLILNGANVFFGGELQGTKTKEAVVIKHLKAVGKRLAFDEVEIMSSNHEGNLIDRLSAEHQRPPSALLVSYGGSGAWMGLESVGGKDELCTSLGCPHNVVKVPLNFTFQLGCHSSALRDAVQLLDCPIKIEVVAAARTKYEVPRGTGKLIEGFGLHSYVMALQAAAELASGPSQDEL